jgi:hypothetical protein
LKEKKEVKLTDLEKRIKEFNSRLQGYANYSKNARLIHVKEVCDVLKGLFRDMRFFEEDFKTKCPVGTINQHPVLHEIRAIFENKNIVENVHILGDVDNKAKMRKTRKVLDINSSRMANSYIADVVLTPIKDSADYDRSRLVNSEIAYLNEKMKDVHETKVYKLDLAQYLNLEHDRDLLLNLTDVLYYLSDSEINDIAEQLNDGTFAVFTIHIPKSNNTDMQLISFGDRIEGEVKVIAPNEDDTCYLENAKMYMKCKGNEQAYIHKVTLPELLREDTTFIKPTKIQQDYIVRVCKMEEVDCGATIYVRGKLQKIRHFTRDTFATSVYAKNFNELEKKMYPITNDMNKDVKFTNILANVNLLKEATKDITIANYEKMRKEKEYADMMKKIDELQAQIRTKNFNGQLCVIREKPGRILNSDKVCTLDLNFTRNYDVKKVEQKVINKMVAKAMVATKMDKNLMKDLLVYYNKEQPESPLETEGVGVIIEVMKKTLTLEQRLEILNNEQRLEEINDFKDSKYEKLPSSLKEAFVNYKLCLYIRHNIRTWLGLVKDTTPNSEEVKDF